ncbi:DUF397 domain-containing protein [Spirillospora sp. CA-108201]
MGQMKVQVDVGELVQPLHRAGHQRGRVLKHRLLDHMRTLHHLRPKNGATICASNSSSRSAHPAGGRHLLQWAAQTPPIVWFQHTHMITAVPALRPGLDQTEISKCGWSNKQGLINPVSQGRRWMFIEWRKSSQSEAQESCVEVARAADRIAVRDSKSREAIILITNPVFRRLLCAIRNDCYNL